MPRDSRIIDYEDIQCLPPRIAESLGIEPRLNRGRLRKSLASIVSAQCASGERLDDFSLTSPDHYAERYNRAVSH